MVALRGLCNNTNGKSYENLVKKMLPRRAEAVIARKQTQIHINANGFGMRSLTSSYRSMLWIFLC